jgi:hypothetical protein
MKKIALSLLLLSGCLFAADIWQTKPFTEWTDKDLQKIMNNSPWAHSFTLPTGGGPSSFDTASGGGGRGGRGGGGADQDSAPAPISETSGRSGRGGGGGGPAVPSSAGGVALEIVARWQSALPLKQALVRLKYGAEGVSSADAKEVLDRTETTYVITLTGPLGAVLKGTPDNLKAGLMDVTTLSAHGKAPIKPTELQVNMSPKGQEVIFAFPRTTPFTVDDKEIDLTTKLGVLPVKYKFKPKEMVFNGKLEL